MRVRRGQRGSGQAMLEFALVVPLLFAIIALVLGVSLIYGVRSAEHKTAYDAARHVAKFYKVRVTDKDSAGNLTPSDLISTDCMDQVDFKDDPTASQMVQEVIEYNYAHSGMMQAFADRPRISRISMGPPIAAEASHPNYYCSQAVSVTLAYGVHVPFWDMVGVIFGGGGQTQLQEIGIATRLGRDYENTSPGNAGYHD